MTRMATTTLLLFVAFMLFSLAHAHMGLEPRTAEAGSRAELMFRIAHDCGDDTVGISNFTIELPQDPPMLGVTVHQVPMWRVMIKMRDLETPINNYTQVVSHVTYLGFLPDHFYMTYRIRGKVPDVDQNTTIYFKGYQDCHNQGTSLAWATIPSEEDPRPRYPARGLLITPKSE